MTSPSKCPRCGTGEFTPYGTKRDADQPPPPALSRAANIDVCSECGLDEALRDVQGLRRIPPDEWPVGGLPTFGEEE